MVVLSVFGFGCLDVSTLDNIAMSPLIVSNASALDVEHARSQFPALLANKDFIFADNAGGSQATDGVVKSFNEYFLQSNVQLGGTYRHSIDAGEKCSSGVRAAGLLVNARDPEEEIILGTNTTQTAENVARAMEDSMTGDEEIIVTSQDHEANIGPWVRLAARKKLILKIWQVNPETAELEIDELKKLLSSKTRLVAVTHCSNIVGSINPIKEIARLVHEVQGAEIAVDGVAYAPHRRIDVQDLNVDYYFLSLYKVYGPHLSVMYAKSSAQERLTSLAHYFFSSKVKGGVKLQPGGASYELQASIPPIIDYLISLVPGVNGSKSDQLVTAFERIALHEQSLIAPLLEYLSSDEVKAKGVKIIGQTSPSALVRVPTISFSLGPNSDLTPARLVDAMHKTGKVGIKSGHFYAHRLVVKALNLGDEGVVRISLVHYNTPKEVAWIVENLKSILK